MQEVGRLADYPEGSVTKVTVGDTDVVIVRTDASLTAFAATCPHAGAPLDEGALCGHRLVCPWHKATFDIDNGSVLEPPALDTLTRYSVRVEGDRVMVAPEPIRFETTPSQPTGHTVLILGSGAGGTAAAVFLREAGFAGRITMIGDESEQPYDRTALSKFVLADMDPSDVPPLRPKTYWTDHQIERREAHIARVDLAARHVHLEDGTILPYDTAILATGAIAKVPPLQGATLSGVHTLRSRDDAARIVALAPEGSKAVVVGSSFIGLEAASALHERGVHVTVVSPETIPFARQFGPEIGAGMRRLHEANGTVFRLGAEVSIIEGTERVTAVSLKTGERLPADFVILGTGVRPATDFVAAVEQEDDGGIKVDATLLAADGFYVIGDAACFPFGTEHVRIEHWRVAQQHGRIAALNIAGTPARYDGVPFFWTYHFGKRFEYAGHPHGWDRIHIDGKLDDERFIALQIRDETVVGIVACQREQATARLIDRMRQPLPLSEAMEMLRLAKA